MAFQLPEFQDDDPDFLGFVERMVHALVDAYQPPRFQVFRTNNWFGPRWVGFCGKVVGAVGFRNYTNIVVPPFVQHRLTAQSLFIRNASGRYDYSGPGPQIHHVGTSSQNFKNLVSQRAPETALFWLSGNSRKNLRASMMTYFPTPSYVLCHFDFERDVRWLIRDDYLVPRSANGFVKEVRAFVAREHGLTVN